jgi:integrase
LNVASLAEARIAWAAHREQLTRGVDPSAAIKTAKAEKQLKRQTERSAVTVETLAADFVRLHSKRHKKSWKADETMLNSLVLPHWGTLQAKAITRRDVNALLDPIAERAPIRANRILAVVRKMFAWAVERDLIELSPCLGVKKPSKEVSRSRVLSDSEIKTLWNGLCRTEIPRATQDALRFQLVTGQRIGEVLGAKWSEFDFKKSEWTIPGDRTKNGRANVVPLSSLALEIVKPLRQAQSDFVFPATDESKAIRIDVLTHSLARATASLELAHFTSHDLRRTAATRLASLGASRVVVEAILNHKDQSVGAIYDRHDYAGEKADALEQWASEIRRLAEADD